MTQVEFLKEVEPLLNKYGFECALLVLTNPTKKTMQLVRLTPLDKLDKKTEDIFNAIVTSLLKQFPIERMPAVYDKDYNQPDKN